MIKRWKVKRDLMHFVCSYTSGYFPIYDYKYEHVHYDDDHVSHDTWEFSNYRTSSYEQLVRLWWTQGGAYRSGTHARKCGSCVGKYYTSNFVRTGGYPNDGFKDKSLIMSCMWLPSLIAIVESLIEYFLKYSCRMLFLFQVKERHPYTTDCRFLTSSSSIFFVFFSIVTR